MHRSGVPVGAGARGQRAAAPQAPGGRGFFVASLVIVAPVALVLGAAIDAGCIPYPSVGPSVHGGSCARPVFASQRAAASFAREWALQLNRSMVVRPVPSGWQVSVPVAPAVPQPGERWGRRQAS